jgi:hypothetical protein
VVVVIFGYRELLMQIFGSNMSGNSSYLENYFEDNLGMFIVIGLLTFILFVMLMIVNYLYPVFYLKRLAAGEKKISMDDILNDFKNNAKKIAILCLGMIFIVTPPALIVLGVSYALVLVLIGIPIMLFVFPTVMNIVNFLMYDMFNSNRGFFESLSYSIRAQFSYANGREKSPYWKYWGATLVLFIIMYVITTIFTMIPMIVFFATMMTTEQDGNFEQNPFSGAMGILFFVLYGFSMLVSFLLSNLMYVNSGLIYYDSRRDLHQQVEMAEIDTIGSNE